MIDAIQVQKRLPFAEPQLREVSWAAYHIASADVWSGKRQECSPGDQGGDKALSGLSIRSIITTYTTSHN